MDDHADRPTQDVEAFLDHVDEGKRTALRQLVTSAAFAVPVLVTFSMNGLNAQTAINTYATNVTNQIIVR
jgi:hypothetical protein